MIRRVALFAVAVVLLAAVGLMSRPTQLDQPPLKVTGDVQMVTSADGLTTVVSVDIGTAKNPPDGVVDHAFRLQHKVEQALAYDGEATVEFTGSALRIEPKEGLGWLMVVTGKWAALNAFDAVEPWVEVIGLSHHWGSRIQLSHDAVAELLLATTCRADGGDPACENCETGGAGAEGCGIECGGGDDGCSTTCGGGSSFACCTCSTGCGCCPDIPTSPAPSPTLL